MLINPAVRRFQQLTEHIKILYLLSRRLGLICIYPPARRLAGSLGVGVLRARARLAFLLALARNKGAGPTDLDCGHLERRRPSASALIYILHTLALAHTLIYAHGRQGHT